MSQLAIPPRRSRRLATFIPVSHWVSLGYSLGDATAMVKLQRDMKKYCDGDDTCLKLEGRPGSALPYHDMILPHWKKLAKSLIGRTNVEEFENYHISMPISVLDNMLPSLQSMNLTRLSLYKTGLGNDEFQRLSTYLKQNTSLIHLFLGGNNFDMSDANCISNALNNHPSIDSLILVQCGLHDTDILGIILEGCKRLTQISIAFEELGSTGVALMSEFIEGNHPVEVVILNHTSISDNDTLLLASALEKNSNLQQLNLRHNNITEEGEKTLLKAVFDPTSMESIIESNHTCLPYTYDAAKPAIVAQRSLLEIELFDIMNDDIGHSIRRKVVLALCGVDGGLFDLSHLNDLPLKLMPRVLGLIQEHTATREKEVVSMANQLEKDALARLFHTLRGWELPLLFGNLSPKNGAAKKRKRKATRR